MNWTSNLNPFDLPNFVGDAPEASGIQTCGSLFEIVIFRTERSAIHRATDTKFTYLYPLVA
jgi:hypothetical protein